MLHFFRRIRQRLLTENRFSRYVLYAVGEIVLVVIGILIALQINNWNEDRKNENQNKLMLSQLLEENRSNIQELTRDKGRDSLVPKIRQFSDFLTAGNIEEKGMELDGHLNTMLQVTSYTFSENYLLSYINSNLQGNTMLTKELVELHTYQKDLAYISEKAFDDRLESLFKTLAKNIDFKTREVHSYETLKSLEFKNKVTLTTYIEKEVGEQYKKTMAQQIKVDSIINSFLRE